MWTGADALEHGLVDELGGLRAAVRRAKVLAGIDADTKAELVSYPSSSLRDFLRPPKPSSQPAAASLPEAIAMLIGRSIRGGAVDQSERALTGTSALWLGDSVFF